MKSKSMIAFCLFFFYVNTWETYAGEIKARISRQAIFTLPDNREVTVPEWQQTITTQDKFLYYLNNVSPNYPPKSICLSPEQTSDPTALEDAERSIDVPKGSVRDAYDRAKRKSQEDLNTGLLCGGIFGGLAFTTENKFLKLAYSGCTLFSGYFLYRGANDLRKLRPFFRTPPVSRLQTN